MTLLTLLALWLAVSIPFALLVGAAIRLADEREGHLDRASGSIPPPRPTSAPHRASRGAPFRPMVDRPGRS
jgi:hypothetical protein